MPAPRLHALHAAGQSIWLDYIDRPMLRDGTLARRIEDDVLSGMTSNPTIFEKALAAGTAYDDDIAAAPPEASPREIFEALAAADVRAACDAFRGVYDATGGADGFVSLEVSPAVADDTAATLAEARRLWARVDRPNAMIKVPGTAAGVAAVRTLIADGINVNVTLLFAVAAHARVMDAYLDGLEARVAAGRPVDRVASVASFFVSRVDGAIDPVLAAAGAGAALRGRAAIANARLAYAEFRRRFSGPRWDALAARGARVQRPLWASTSTKNPAYRDVLYVEELIGPDTVNTMPPATLDAFRDHGEVRRSVDEDPAGAAAHLAALAAHGIDFAAVTDRLLAEGLAAFQASFDALLAGLCAKAHALGRPLAAAR